MELTFIELLIIYNTLRDTLKINDNGKVFTYSFDTRKAMLEEFIIKLGNIKIKVNSL